VTDPADPRRWSDAAGDAPEHVRGILEACRGDVGSAEEIRALEASLSAILAPNAPPPSPELPTAPSGPAGAVEGAGRASLLAKAGAGIVVAALGATGLWLAQSDPEPEPEAARGAEPPGAAATAPVAPPALPSPPAAVSVGPTPTAPEAASGREAASAQEPGSHAGQRASSSRSAPGPEPSAAGPSEADLLGAAQAALAASPARSLSLVGEHARKFPRGLLVQEREVLAIEALSRLGRAQEASARAERFLAAFPRSAHRTKVLNLVR
jgi:hypothetical protein